MDSIKKFVGNPVVKLSLLVAVVMFFLVYFAGIVTIDVSPTALLGKSFFNFILSWRLGASLILIALVFLTYRELRANGKLVKLDLIVSWALVIGMIVGGGLPAYLKYAEKQDAKRRKLEAVKAHIALADDICKKFPEEKICQVYGKSRDEDWADKVQACFSTEEDPSLALLPEECSSFNGKGIMEGIIDANSLDGDNTVQPVVAPEILAAETEAGEKVAKSITPQTVIIAGEVVVRDKFLEIVKAIAVGETPLFGGPSSEGDTPPVREDDDEIGKLIDRYRMEDGSLGKIPPEEAQEVLSHILNGKLYPEEKSEIEKELGVKIGLSQNLESLSPEEKQGVGLLLGIFNHTVRMHAVARERVKVTAQKECAKYPAGTLRPVRCAAIRR